MGRGLFAERLANATSVVSSEKRVGLKLLWGLARVLEVWPSKDLSDICSVKFWCVKRKMWCFAFFFRSHEYNLEANSYVRRIVLPILLLFVDRIIRLILSNSKIRYLIYLIVVLFTSIRGEVFDNTTSSWVRSLYYYGEHTTNGFFYFYTYIQYSN